MLMEFHITLQGDFGGLGKCSTFAPVIKNIINH